MQRALAWTLLLSLAAMGAGAAPGKGRGEPFDLQAFVDGRLAARATRIVVPPGRYRVTPRNRCHLTLRNLANVTLVMNGVEMVCTETTRAVTLDRCENVTLRGLTIDYDPLPFTQGRITAISADKADLDIALDSGYPPAEQATNFKYEVFRPDTRTLRREDTNVRAIEAVDARHLRIHKAGARPTDAEQVGDIIAIGAAYAPHGSEPHAVVCTRCRAVRLENVSLFASNCFGFLETDCDGTTYSHCRIDRRPLTDDPFGHETARIRSLDADAYHSISAVKGPAYLQCTAGFMGDDCINIHGTYHLVTAAQGSTLRVLSNSDQGINIEPGDSIEMLTYAGTRLPDAKVTAVEPDGQTNDTEREFINRQSMYEGWKNRLPHASAFKLTLDRAVDLPMGSVVCSTRRTGNGFVVRGCNFGHNRSRGILIKASDGEVTGNTITGSWMAAVLVTPEWWWMESGSSNNVKITNNHIVDCREAGIIVTAAGGQPGPAPAGAHNNLTITGNRIERSALPGIVVTSTRGLTLAHNTVTAPSDLRMPPWRINEFGLKGRTVEPVMLVSCEEVKESE